MFSFSSNGTTKYNKVVRTTKPIHVVAKKPVGLESKQIKSKPNQSKFRQ